ncbi:MAG: DedA family protein [Propioniciclava sp.]
MDPTQWDAPLPIIIGALFCIVMARANATYWAGRLITRGAARTRASAVLDSPGYQRTVDRLNRWGAPVVTLSFLTVGVQTMVNMAAGATRMPLRRYLPAVIVGCIIWALIYGTVGFIGFAALGLLWDRAPVLTVVLAAALAMFFIGFIIWRVREARAGRVPVPAPTEPDTRPGAVEEAATGSNVAN